MNAARTRVCFVIPSLGAGGTERQLVYLLEGIRDTHDATVICTRKAGAWADYARATGARVHELNTWGGWDIRIGRRVRSLLREIKPHVLQTFLFGFDLPVNRVAREESVPVVISSRREIAAWMKPRHLRAQREANALVDCVVANSNAVARYAIDAEGIGAARVRVIHNGIDAEATAEKALARISVVLPEGRAVVGMLANFSSVKDHALFLAAARELLELRPDVHFLLVGSGGLQKQIAGGIHRYGMQERFTITSATENAAALLARMDICVTTSLREGFPNAILEAMSLGRPVVAAAVGGIPELVEHDVTGLLVNSREPHDFAHAIDRVLGDASLARALGDTASGRVRTAFPVARMVESYRGLYAELLLRAQTGSTSSCAASAE